MAIDGDTMVVGAPGTDVGGNARGAVYVFTLAGATWTQTARLTASDGADLDKLGTSVDIDGSTIVAGAPGDNSGAGSVYTFDRTGGDRIQRAKVAASDGTANDLLGQAVAIDGDTIVAGAPSEDAPLAGATEDQGAVYTFASAATTGQFQTAKLTTIEGATPTGFFLGGDGLGESVDIDGDTIVAGAPRDTQAGPDATPRKGAVFTFSRSGGTRTETAKLTLTPSAAGRLGGSVAIDQNTIVAGDVEHNNAFGAAFTFAATGEAARNQTARLTSRFPHQNERFGYSVAIDPRSIIVGAPSNPAGAQPHGAAMRFARTGADRVDTDADAAGAVAGANPEHGYSVATDGGWLIAGAPADKTNGDGSGAVHAFKLPDYPAVDETPGGDPPGGDPPGGDPPGGDPPTGNPPTGNPPAGGGADDRACEKAREKFKRARAKLKRLRQDGAPDERIDRAKEKVKKARQGVKDAC